MRAVYMRVGVLRGRGLAIELERLQSRYWRELPKQQTSLVVRQINPPEIKQTDETQITQATVWRLVCSYDGIDFGQCHSRS